MRRFGIVLLFIAVLTLACSPLASESPRSAPAILTSTTFLADIARNITDGRAQVESLLPNGADPHSYQPTPRDVAKISDRKVLIINGAEYEHFLEPLLENAGGERTIIEASAGLKSRSAAPDPHFWLDPNHVIVYAENIREGLIHADPEGAVIYNTNTEAYIAQLKDLDGWIKEQVAQIPPERRLLVTNHESLGYFADRYGLQVVGAVVPGTSSEAAPSAKQIAALVDQIKSSGAPAIFLDATDNPNLASQIASETNVKVIIDLHLESLTNGEPAATYIDMMKHNVTQIVNGLK